MAGLAAQLPSLGNCSRAVVFALLISLLKRELDPSALYSSTDLTRYPSIILTFGEIGRYGRLGNQLFQVASTIGIANSLGVKYDFPSHISETEVGSLFGLNGDLHPSNLESAVTLYEEAATYYNITLPHGLTDGIFSLFGYFQSPLYFNEHAPILKTILSLKPHFFHSAEKAIPEIVFSDTVAIHVRRGDYLALSHLYNVLTIEYYVRALNSLGDIGTVIVTSDDMEWCREMFVSLPYNFIFSPFKDAIYDFVLLTRARKLVMANSSFSWWAAYLKRLHFGNATTIIAPSPWYNPRGALAHANSNELYLAEWDIIHIIT